MFATNSYVMNNIDRNLNGIIGTAPCPPAPENFKPKESYIFNEISFFYQIKSILGGFEDIKWNVTNQIYNNGDPSKPGNGYISINPK